MPSYIIERGSTGRGRPAKYPLADLGIGDRFLVPSGEDGLSAESIRRRLEVAIYHHRKTKSPQSSFKIKQEDAGFYVTRRA